MGKPDRQTLALAILTIAFVGGMYAFSERLGYPVFHFFSETFCALIGFSIFLVGWNARRSIENHYFLLVSIAFLFASLLGMLHMLTFKGMNIIPDITSDVPTQLWISMRYLTSIPLLMAPLFIRRKLNVPFTLLLFCVLFGLTFWSIFIGKSFPACLVEPGGLTPFKIISEYVIIAIFFLALVGVIRNRNAFDGNVLLMICSGIVFSILGEICFTLYVSPFDLANFAGHMFIIFSFYCFYKAIVETGIRQPYNLLFYNLTRSERQLRTVLDMLPIGVWLTNEKGQIVLENPAAGQIWDGIDTGGVDSFGDYKGRWNENGRPVAPDEWPIARAIQFGEKSLNKRIDIKPSGQAARTISQSAVPLHGNNDSIIGAVVTTEDITERRRAEQALAESEERFRGIFSQAGVGIMQMTPDLRPSMVNQRLLDMLGYSHEEMRNLSIPELTHPEDMPLTRQMLDRILGREINGYHIEKRYLHKDGRGIWTTVSVSAIHETAGAVSSIIVAVQDISARKQAEEELTALTETLEQRVEERTAVAEERAVRLRALAAALTNAEQQERQRLAQILHDHIQQLLVAARMGIDRVSRKMPEFLDKAPLVQAKDLLSQAIDAARNLTMQLCPPVLMEEGLVAALAWLAAQMEEKHSLKVTLEVAKDTDTCAQHLCVPLYHAVRELLFNIVKHAQVDEATVRLTNIGGDKLQITVEDQGKGFAAGNESVENLSPSSFGLYSVQKRIALEGGDLKIESEPGKGTRAIIVVPADKSSEVEAVYT